MAKLMNLFKSAFSKRKISFLPEYQKIAAEIENGQLLSATGEYFSKASINNYKTMAHRFELFEQENGTIYVGDINIQWADRLRICLMENDYTKNSIANTLAVLKAMLRRMANKGICTFNGSGISCAGETVTTVYNTIDEIRRMLDTDLSDTPGYERIRNIYVINCFLGLRFNDLKRLLKSVPTYMRREAGKTFIEIKTHKTGEIVVIPVSQIVSDLLTRHDHHFPEGFGSSYYNKSIKEIAKRSGITNEVIFTRTEGGQRKDTTFKKYELMSSHTARRSFATNATLSGLSQRFIMGITGHRTVSSFERYIRCSNLEAAIEISNHAFFSLEMPGLYIGHTVEKINLID